MSTELNTFDQGIQIIQPVKQRAPTHLYNVQELQRRRGKKNHETDELGEKGLKGLHCVALSSTQPSGSSGEMKKKKEI